MILVDREKELEQAFRIGEVAALERRDSVPEQIGLWIAGQAHFVLILSNGFDRRAILRSALGYKPAVEFEAELRPVAPTLNQDEALSVN